MWFADPAAGQPAFTTEQRNEIMADLPTFADMERLVMSVAEEKVIIG